MGWDDDQQWYYVAGFKESPYLFRKYHLDCPKMLELSVRFEQWLQVYEDSVEALDHLDNNKPVRAAPIEIKISVTKAKDI